MYICQLSGKTGNFDFFSPNLPKNGFCGCDFKNLSLNLESVYTSKIPCVLIFRPNGQLLFFWSEFGEIAQLHAIFWL